MSLTLTTLRAIIRRQITDTSDWPNATLDGWIQDAIRDYSREFPRALRKTQAMTTGTQAYDLPGGQDFVSVLRVEYPGGQNPPEFLALADEGDTTFQAGGYAYALRPPADDLADELDTAAGQIVLAPTVATGQTCIITYQAQHAVPVAADDDAIITVPNNHVEALVAFCSYRQAEQLRNNARFQEHIANDKLGQLQTDAQDTWERYVKILEDLRLGAQRAQPASVSWNRLGLEDTANVPDYKGGYQWV